MAGILPASDRGDKGRIGVWDLGVHASFGSMGRGTDPVDNAE